MNTKEIIIIEGDYYGCEATVFTKGGEYYFRDDEKGCDVKLDNHLYIEKNGVLEDVILLLSLAKKSENLKSFIKKIDELIASASQRIKEPSLLRRGRIEKFYIENNLILDKLKELLKDKKDEHIVLNELLTFINDIKLKGLCSTIVSIFAELSFIDLLTRGVIIAFSFIVGLFK